MTNVEISVILHVIYVKLFLTFLFTCGSLDRFILAQSM